MTTKGNAKLLTRLGRIKQTPVVPEWMVALAQGDARLGMPADADRIYNALHTESGRVFDLRRKLEAIPPSWKLESTLL